MYHYKSITAFSVDREQRLWTRLSARLVESPITNIPIDGLRSADTAFQRFAHLPYSTYTNRFTY